MNSRLLLRTVFVPLLPLLGATVVAAAGGPPDSARRGRGGAGNSDGHICSEPAENNDFTALERFLDMSDEQLDRIQQAIAKVRAMSPAERATLHAQLHAFRQLPPAQRERVRAGWRNNRDQDDWPKMMRALSDERRSTIQAEIQALSPTERAARKHALLEEWRAGKAAEPPSE